MGNPIPYFPANVNDNSGDTLTMHSSETINGHVIESGVVPSGEWKYCGGGTFAAPTLPLPVFRTSTPAIRPIR